jgi:hypothetical protein
MRLLTLRAAHAVPLGKFPVLISLKRPNRPQGHRAAEKIFSIEKKYNYLYAVINGAIYF